MDKDLEFENVAYPCNKSEKPFNSFQTHCERIDETPDKRNMTYLR